MRKLYSVAFWKKFLLDWTRAGEDIDKMWDVIVKVATEFHYLRAGEQPGKSKSVGQVSWESNFPEPKDLEGEAGSAEQDTK
eukprot:595193-Heterocapsa_arctica.AAC.1